jgi:hypothetical protein
MPTVRGWTGTGVFFLPLTDDASIYPQWTTMTGEDVVNDRLGLAPPNQNLPWDDPFLAVADNLKIRYLLIHFPAIDEGMRLFLKGELAQGVPQALVEVVQELEESPPGDPPENVIATVRPLEHVYAAAADPQVARLLGLMTTDLTDPFGVYDYLVTCRPSGPSFEWSLFPKGGGGPLDTREDSCLAIATAIAAKVALPPEPPADLAAKVDPDLTARPVPAQVELSWRVDPRGGFENGMSSRVFYELKREGKSGEVLLHHKEDDSGLLLPHVPTVRQPSDGRLRLVDREVPDWDTYTWRVRGMDLWGRFSEVAEVTADVQDTLAPPAPTSVEARLNGNAAAAPTWADVTISFDWSDQQSLIAPDLARFELHLVQREVDRSEAGNPATWGRFEHTPGATRPPITLQWPNLQVAGPPPGTTGTVTAVPIPTEEGGGQRISVSVAPVSVPFGAGAGDAAVASVSLRAIDVFENTGPFSAHVAARRHRETPPVVPQMPGDIQLASPPDALGRAAFKVKWPNLGGGQVRVLRAAGDALLAAANFDMDDYAAQDRPTKAGTLRLLALSHHEEFGPDHEMPYPGGAGAHVAFLDADETGLTVFVVEPTSATGVRASWPTAGAAFVVVAVPQTRPPATPFVTDVRAGDRQVVVRVAPALSGEALTLRLYRARQATDAADVRRMRLVGEAEVAAGQEAELDDHDVYPDADYWYRVVALGETGPSEPSAPAVARPYSSVPPPPPVLLGARRLSPGGSVSVSCSVGRRDYPLFLLRRLVGRVEWLPAEGAHFDGDGRIDMSAVATTSTANGYAFAIEDLAPANGTFRYVLRTRDGQGRGAESNEVEEIPS